jgi:hypothetical protein
MVCVQRPYKARRYTKLISACSRHNTHFSLSHSNSVVFNVNALLFKHNANGRFSHVVKCKKQTNTTRVYKRLIHIQCVRPKKGMGERERGEGKVVGKGGRSRRRTWRGISKPFSLKTVLFYLHELNTQQSRLITRKYTRTPAGYGEEGRGE